MKKLTYLLLLFVSMSQISNAQVIVYADTLVSFPPISQQRYNEIDKQIANLQNKEWIDAQIASLKNLKEAILLTLMDSNGKEASKYDITGFDPKTNSLIVKPKIFKNVWTASGTAASSGQDYNNIVKPKQK